MPAEEPAKPDRSGPAGPEVEIRRADETDLPAVLELAHAALGWDPADPNEDYFRWKHLENPVGPSPMWVAMVDGRVAGFRVFLRWRFRRVGGSTTPAVRAVDTATHPDFQGKGIFSRLTLGALAELQEEGVEFVFNTPNEQSRPGYLKMGWHVVGRVPIRVRPHGLPALARIARARTAAAKWSIPTEAGVAATDALADDGALWRLLETTAGDAPTTSLGLTTDRSPEYLRWRYRFAPLRYRAFVAPGGVQDGLAIFRLRRRGEATEAVLCELLAPRPDRGPALLRDVADSTAADYVITAGTTVAGGHLVRLPRQGPILTWRRVQPEAVQAPLPDWALTMGDIELF